MTETRIIVMDPELYLLSPTSVRRTHPAKVSKCIFELVVLWDCFKGVSLFDKGENV